MKTANYIEGKVEEFRLSGKSPAWIGLDDNVMQSLAEELQGKSKNLNVELSIGGLTLDARFIVTEFLGLRVSSYVGPEMPSDGVYIQEVNGGSDGSLL